MRYLLISSWLLLTLELPGYAANLKNEFLKAMCDSPKQINLEDSVCTACPAYITPVTRIDSQLTIGNFFLGHFSAKDRDEVLVVTDGCSRYGGSVFLWKTGHGWQRFHYESGLKPGNCIPFVLNDGRETLVCDNTSMHFGAIGYGFEQVTVEDDVVNRKQIIGNNVLESNEAGGAPRNGHNYSISPEGFQATKIGQTPALSIDVSAEIDTIKKHYTLTYKFNGDSFEATPDTEKSLTELLHFLD